MDLSKYNDTFSKTLIVLVVLTILAAIGTYFSQIATNDAYAEGILNDVWMRAEQRKNVLNSLKTTGEEDMHNYVEKSRIGRWGYIYTILDDSTAALVKVETAQKPVSYGTCKALKNKLMDNQWQGIFDKIIVLDRMRDEKLDILVHDCPDQEIAILRFYVRFAPDTIVEPEPVEEVLPEATSPTPLPSESSPTPVTISTSDSSSRPRVSYSRPNAPRTKSVTCPSGTSSTGRGGFAVSGCRCNGIGEIWNGKTCEVKNCPQGSSRDSSNAGDMTNVPGCRCKSNTPKWHAGKCIAQCSGDKVFVDGECVCPPGKVSKRGKNNLCVECNTTSECFAGYRCINNTCLNEQEEYDDCRWGICQTCDEKGNRGNIIEHLNCKVGGLDGVCNGNGTCYPVKGQGRRCSSARGCPSGYFCNYGGSFNSSKKQRGKFGQTPDVCQLVEPQEFTHKKVTYYYNSQNDLKSWCRAANNKPNCLWGYLAKPGAESWCASLGKRLLTKAEMSEVWPVLKKHLPKTYTGYSYWVQEGAWITDEQGRRSFSKGHLDGYGGKGGVICR